MNLFAILNSMLAIKETTPTTTTLTQPTSNLLSNATIYATIVVAGYVL